MIDDIIVNDNTNVMSNVPKLDIIKMSDKEGFMIVTVPLNL